MEYGKIISITGMSGLYELVGSKKDGAIVKSLDDKVTKFVASRIHNFSHLESIEVYTVRDNVNLVELLKAMEDSGKPLPNEKDAAAIKGFFKDVYPDLDFEKVYASDMKKMIKWYSVLKANDVEFKLTEVEEDEEEANNEVEEGQPLVTQPVAEAMNDNVESFAAGDEEQIATPASATKKPVAEVEPVVTGAEAEAPKKRAPRKKKSEE